MSHEIDNDGFFTKPDPRHVDEWLDRPILQHEAKDHEAYARWVLEYFRMPAWKQCLYQDLMKDHQLFAMHNGSLYRVTGASVGGVINLQINFTHALGCQHTCWPEDVTRWGKHP